MNLENIFCSKLSDSNFKEISPIVLAFIGDAVHTLYIRDKVVAKVNLNVNKCHLQSSKKCNAKAQSIFLDKIYNSLNDIEKDIIKRARNSKTHHIAKNSDVETYKKATSFEALIGYLFLKKDFERLNQILLNEE